ncbi:hypothetical protein HM1_0187 [Heliomicrobium modesticaldum Ice1]|uniref:Uncharacterized protein n=1 Tax=Heliobacterium modesticaldum (strain ATCC 51547 / Ice1) TaxID=498761 RepID=B0TDU3_HELMI|nr:hypothetical protein [Heliomicrobium modesticaldum]ABZ82806.1 hypothetical protein HM1_0187 [Heliomicrobium modesticaldum Ice1]
MRQFNEFSPHDKALLQLDADYQRYRQSVEFAFQLAQDLVNRALEPVMNELTALRQALEELKATVKEESERQASAASATPEAATEAVETISGLVGETPRRGRRRRAAGPVAVKPPRIRWGNSEDEIKATIFEQLRLLEERGKEITVTNIKEEVPSMMRFLYGKDAMFQGISALFEEYQRRKSASELPVQTAAEADDATVPEGGVMDELVEAEDLAVEQGAAE